MNIFEYAARNKLRFTDRHGRTFNTEDLFDLPLKSRTKSCLDDIAILLNKQIKEYGEQSFVSASTVPKELEVMFDVVKFIIASKQADQEKEDKARQRREELRVIDELLHNKKHESLASKSLEELMQLRESISVVE